MGYRLQLCRTSCSKLLVGNHHLSSKMIFQEIMHGFLVEGHNINGNLALNISFECGEIVGLSLSCNQNEYRRGESNKLDIQL